MYVIKTIKKPVLPDNVGDPKQMSDIRDIHCSAPTDSMHVKHTHFHIYVENIFRRLAFKLEP